MREAGEVKADRSLLDLVGIVSRHLDALENVIGFGGHTRPIGDGPDCERELVTPERSFEDKLSAVEGGLNGIDNRIRAITERLTAGMLRI